MSSEYQTSSSSKARETAKKSTPLTSDTILHLETLSMMSKYQLVFVKLESSLLRIIRSLHSRQREMLFKQFTRWSKKTRIYNTKIKAIERVTTSTMRSFLKACARTYKKSKLYSASKRLYRWKLAASKSIIAKKCKSKYMAEANAMHKTIEEKDEVTKNNNKATHSLTAQIAELNTSISRLKEEYKKNEELEKSIKAKYEAAKKKETLTKDEKITQLKNQIALLEADNVDLKQKIESTEATVGAFINEMTQLVDSQELIAK